MKPSKKYDGIQLTILTYAGQTYQPALEILAEEFRELTGATIRNRALPAPFDWWALVPLAQADAASENPQFDMFCDDSNHTWSLWSHLVPLNDLITNFDYDMNDCFAPVYRDGEAIQAGVRFGLPLRVRVPVIFYRKDLLGQLPSTWEDYNQALAKVTEGGVHGIAVAGAGYPFHPYGQAYELTKAFLARYWSLGDPILSSDKTPLINSANGVSALEMLKDQVRLYASPETSHWDEVAAANAFLEGQAATIECVPHYLLPHLQNPQRSKVVGKWAIGTYPGTGGGYFSMHEMVIFKHSKNSEAAFEFLAYCTNPANSERLFVRYGETTARRTPWLDNRIAKQIPDLPNIVSALDQGITFAAGQPQWLEMLSALWETIGYFMKGYMSSERALNLAAAKWRQSLERNPIGLKE